MPTPRTAASRKYNEKTYDRVEFTVPKGEKATIAAAATGEGMSMNAFINEAVAEKMARLRTGQEPKVE